MLDSRGPHNANNKTKNRDCQGEGRHYTAFGFLQAEGGPDERFLEQWYMHIYVDGEDLFSGVYCGTSVENVFRRNITVNDMTFLSVSCIFRVGPWIP